MQIPAQVTRADIWPPISSFSTSAVTPRRRRREKQDDATTPMTKNIIPHINAPFTFHEIRGAGDILPADIRSQPQAAGRAGFLGARHTFPRHVAHFAHFQAVIGLRRTACRYVFSPIIAKNSFD